MNNLKGRRTKLKIKFVKYRGELNGWYGRGNFNYNITSVGLSYILGNKINN